MPPGIVTLLSLRTSCKQQSDNVGQSFVSDPEWNSYIQSSYQELYGLVVQAFGNDYFTNGPSFFQFTTDGVKQFFSLPDGTTTFKNPDNTTAPAVFKLLTVDLQVSAPNYWVALKPFTLAERNKLSVTNTTVPMAGQVVRLMYVPRATVPVADGDTIDGVNGWEDYIVVDACIKALAKEESDIQPFLLRKSALVERIAQEAENRDAGSPMTIADVLGRRARAMQYRLNGTQLWLIGNGQPGWGPVGDWGDDGGGFF